METARPRGQILSADWSPDGKQIACGMATGHIRIYDAATLKLVRIIDNGTTSIKSVTWSPDGTRLAIVASSDDTTIRIWTVTGSLIASFPRSGATELAWHPSGDLIAAGYGSTIGRVDLYTVDGGKQTLDFLGAKNRCLAWSPTGDQLAVGTYGGTVRLWSMDDSEWRVLDICDGANTPVSDVAWHPDGGKLAAALSHAYRTVAFGMEGTVLESFQQEDNGYSVDWSRDGTKIVGSGRGSGVYIWPLDGSDVVVLKEHLYLAFNAFVSASPKENRFMSFGQKDGNLRLWTFDGQPAGTLMGAPIVLDADCDSDGLIASGDGASRIRFWQDDGRMSQSIGSHTDAVTSVTWHPTAAKLAIGVHNGVLLSIDSGTEQTMLETGYEVASLSWESQTATLLAVGVSGQVALWSADGQLLGAIWDHRIKQLHTFNAACCWTHDGQHFLTAAFDGTIRYYQAHPVEPQWVAVTCRTTRP